MRRGVTVREGIIYFIEMVIESINGEEKGLGK